MSREYNNQGIHRAEKELAKAEEKLKRWGGSEERDKYIQALKDLHKEEKLGDQNERLNKQWFGH